MFFRFFLVLATFAIAFSQSYSWNLLGKYDHFAKRPSSLVRTFGRMTERQIGYAAQAGYQSIISIANFTSDDSSFNNVEGSFPSSTHEIEIGQNYGLAVFNYPIALNVNDVLVVSDLINKAPKPILLHCHVGYSATLFFILHMNRVGLLPSSQIYNYAMNFGYDYQSNPSVVDLINQFTGLTDSVTDPVIEKTFTNGETSYKTFYWAHRVGDDNWYNQGQPLDTLLPSMVKEGYKTILSFRSDNEPTLRLPSEPSTGGPVNNHEFSNDSTGNYDVSLEKTAVENAGMNFIHLPISSFSSTGGPYTKESFELAYPDMKKANENGPVLAHCASGYRSAAYSTAFLAREKGQCSDWALKQSKNIGFDFDSSISSDTDKQVISFFKAVLGC